MPKKSASGTGTIRKKTITRQGKEYTYWEARYTAGYDAGTGKQIQRSITGKTQKEVAQKLKSATASIDAGTYTAPSKLTVAQWLDVWQGTYLGAVKPRTASLYRDTIRLYLCPNLGAIKLETLATHTIQAFYNALGKPSDTHKALSPKTVKNIHDVLHKALQQAVSVGYIRYNPADPCTLPRIERKEIQPLDDEAITRFLQAIQGHPMRAVFMTTLFTGLRQGEVLGLQWGCIDFLRGTMTIKQQLQQDEQTGEYLLASPKNSKTRVITPAPAVLEVLVRHRAEQTSHSMRYAEVWQDTGLVFTDDFGAPCKPHTVYHAFKAVAREIGLPEARFHDLRHSYAVAALRAGDDIKTVQGNLGHATASFTLDVYGHVTDQMKQESANRMQAYIRTVCTA